MRPRWTPSKTSRAGGFALLLTAATFAVPAAASAATTYCVGADAACPAGGTTKPDLQAALSAASGSGDKVVLGTGTFVGPASGFQIVVNGTPLTIVGAGAGSGGTILTRAASVRTNAYQGASVLDLQARPVDLSGVAVELPAPTGLGSGLVEGYGIVTGGTSRLHDIAVRTAPAYAVAATSTSTGVVLRDSAALERATVDVAAPSASRALTIRDAKIASAPVTVVDSTLRTSNVGFQADASQVAVRRSSITATQPVDLYDGTLRVESSLLRGANSRLRTGIPAGGTATFDASTLVGAGSGVGFETWADQKGSATTTFRSSILTGFDNAAYTRSSLPLTASTTLADSDLWDSGSTVEIGSASTTRTRTTSVDPVFVDASAGNYRLALASPLIDRGETPAPAGLGPDLAGDARVVDGDGDGVARLDMGAFERGELPKDQPPVDTNPGGTTPGGTTTPGTTTPGTTTTPTVPLPPAVPPRVPKAGFGASPKVTVRLRATKIGASGPAGLMLANTNAFAVPVRVSVTTPKSGRRKAIPFAGRLVTLKASGRSTVSLTLPAKARSVLRSRRRLTLRVTLRLTAPDGGVRTVRKTLVVRRR